MLRLSLAASLAAVALSAAAAGCGSAAPTSSSSAGRSPAGSSGDASTSATQLRSYIGQVEPIRLAVNRLLEGADPILAARHDGQLSAATASRRIGALERRFAADAVAIGTVRAGTAQLAALNAPYAHTYVLEDAYLSALADGLSSNRLDDLPDTSAAQREAIVAWRIGLEVIAREDGVTLPADAQQAGRGEIRPSPQGGS